jgi:hypothetical protein
VPGPILAVATSDNTPAGAVLTFALPLGLFIIVAVVLYLRFARPHARVPAVLAPGPGNVSGQDGGPAAAAGGASAPGTANGGEATSDTGD